MKILFTSSEKNSTLDVTIAVKSSITETGHEMLMWTDEGVLIKNLPVFAQLENGLSNMQLLIADISENYPDIMLEVGFAKAKRTPIIAICRQEDLGKVKSVSLGITTVFYDRQRLQETLILPLKNYLTEDGFAKLKTNEELSFTKKNTDIKSIFLSYSHEDVLYLDRLRIHLKPFEKRGLVDLWSDTKIKVGEKWREKIEHALEKSAIAILLISADFLASDFIIDNELPPLLKGAEEKGKVILPVIIKPCRFSSDENLSQFQSLNDPKIPMSKMNESEREELYVKLAESIQSLIK